MIITLISIIMFIIGIVCLRLYDRNLLSSDRVCLVGCYTAIIGGVILFFVLATIIGSHINIDKKIQEAQMKRESIERQIECISSNYEDVSKTSVIERVYEWNKEVYSQRYRLNSPWTSWFYSKKYVDSLEYIEMEGGRNNEL